MTFAPETIQKTRKLKIQHLDLHPTSHNYPNDLDPDEVGIVGDTAHAAKGTSYHLGKDQLTSTAYSRRTARDKAGLSNAASAEDVGYFKVTTAKGTFDLKHYTKWLFAECRKSAPDTLDLREVIGTVDGKTVLRWDAERGRDSAPRSGEADSSHLTHTHKAWYRDSEFRAKTPLDERYLREIGVTEGDDMQITDKIPYVQGPEASYSQDSTTAGTMWGQTLYYVLATRNKIAANEAADKARDEAILALLKGASGGSVDVLPVLERINAVRVEVLAKLEAEFNALELERDELQARLAAALAGQD